MLGVRILLCRRGMWLIHLLADGEKTKFPNVVYSVYVFVLTIERVQEKFLWIGARLLIKKLRPTVDNKDWRLMSRFMAAASKCLYTGKDTSQADHFTRCTENPVCID